MANVELTGLRIADAAEGPHAMACLVGEAVQRVDHVVEQNSIGCDLLDQAPAAWELR